MSDGHRAHRDEAVIARAAAIMADHPLFERPFSGGRASVTKI
jgi:hypothetical protein